MESTDPHFAGLSYAHPHMPRSCPGEHRLGDLKYDDRQAEIVEEPTMPKNAEKEICSLGAILLEIGEWCPLRDLVQEAINVTQYDDFFFR